MNQLTSVQCNTMPVSPECAKFYHYKKVTSAFVENRMLSYFKVFIKYLYTLLLVYRNFKLVHFIFFIAGHKTNLILNQFMPNGQ